MKKFILPSILIGVILFFWQFVSFAAANLHHGSQQYTAKQDTIIKFMSSLNLPDGKYMIPIPAPELKPEEKQKIHSQNDGKPWMSVSYYSKMDVDMSKPLIRGLLSDIVAGFFLMFILNAIGSVSLMKSIFHAVAIGIFGFIFIPYTNHVWYPAFDIPAYLIDAIVPYSLIGFLNAKFWNK
jgi:hypothetical protein